MAEKCDKSICLEGTERNDRLVDSEFGRDRRNIIERLRSMVLDRDL